jgi:uracil-DNA glycosylase
MLQGTINEIAELRSLLPDDKSYSKSGMAPLGTNIESGLGFFPYSNGLWEGKNARATFPLNGIMILGQDFGTTGYVEKLKSLPESEGLPTWRNIKKLMKECGINMSDCFFTNAIMGVRIAGEPMVGKSPPFKRKHHGGKDFLDACYTFFEHQVAVQKPKMIICLGKWPLEMLSQRVANNPFINFNVNESYNKIGKHIHDVDIKDHKSTLVLIVHPSTPKRPIGRQLNDDADLVKQALKHINYVSSL